MNRWQPALNLDFSAASLASSLKLRDDFDLLTFGANVPHILFGNHFLCVSVDIVCGARAKPKFKWMKTVPYMLIDNDNIE